MPSKIVRKKSLCRDCPLDGSVRNKVYGVSDTDNPEIVLLGEAPGADEDSQGVPFVGVSGRMLKSAVDATGHLWHKAHKTNVILCRPPKNNYSCAEAIEAQERCRPGLIEELYELKKRKVKVIIAVGASAMKALSIAGSIGKYRGSVFMIKLIEDGPVESTDSKYDFIVIPTYHPSFLLRGMIKHEVTFANDIDKAYSFVGKRYQPPAENFLLFPTIEEIEGRVDECIASQEVIGVDIETSGFIPGRARILVVGVSTSETDAFSIPFSTQGGGDYWQSKSERMRAHGALQRLMAEVPTMFQNALFDMRHLLVFGTPVLKLKHDTMLLSHAISPELPHNIGYIVSVYGRTPYWKEEVLQASSRMIDLPDDLMRTYNLRDCVTLNQVIGPMLEEARDRGTLLVYEKISMPLVYPIITMIENGMLLDKGALTKWKRYLTRTVNRLEKQLFETGALPDGFNLASGDHLRYLLYQKMPAQYERALRELEKYEHNDKLKRTTKKYQNLVTLVETFRNVTPFKKLRHTIKKTESGSLSIDEEAMLNVQIAAANRLSEITKLRRLRPDHVDERDELQKIVSFIGQYREYAEYQKLQTTYTSFPHDPNNRVKFPYRITGTATGRLSSGSKKTGEAGNAQNIPKEAKHLFIAPPGNVLAQFDYSNLELRVIAEISNDAVLRGIFAKGLNVHSENCKALFGLSEDDPLWDSARKACKTYIFGRNYGGGLTGIYRRVAKAVPELNLTFEKFKDIDAKYRSEHPMYDVWYAGTIKQVTADRCLENAFGRKRYFLGKQEEIMREGLNFPIQSCLMPETRILTMEGWKEIQHFRGGDVWTGETWSHADVITARGKRTTLHLSDGTTFLCDDNHKLLVENGPWPAWCNVLDIIGKVLVEDRNVEFGIPQEDHRQWYWAGRLMGDGYVKKDGSWGIAFNSTTKRIAQEAFVNWLKQQPELSPEQPYRSYKNGYTSEPGKKVSLYAVATRAIWQRWGFEPGVGARNKKVPDVVFTLDRRSRMAFLSGWYDSDGTVVKGSRRGGVYFDGRLISRLTSASTEAVQSGIKLAKTLGLNAKAAKEYSKKGLSWGGILFTQKRDPLTVDRIDVGDEWETTYTLSVQDERHAYSSEGLISKNTAADVLNFALIELHKQITNGTITAKLVASVHDSLIFEIPETKVKAAIPKIKAIMEQTITINKKKIAFPVDVEIGKDWGHLKSYEIKTKK